MLPRHALLAHKLIFTVSAGFALALTLIAALTLLGLSQLAENNARLETIVNKNNVKTRLANQMRDILRDRAISMLSIVVTTDPFEKDQEMMSFYAYGSAYQGVRQELRSLADTPTERKVLGNIDNVTRNNQPVMVEVVDLAMDGYTFLAFEVLQQEALPKQHELVKLLDELTQLQRNQTAAAAGSAKREYTRVRDLMILLGTLAILTAGLVAWAVVRRTARLAADSERERTKFRTLFETNTDGIVILDQHGFTDCNPATLAMFQLENREEFLGRRPEQLGTEIQPGGTPSKLLAETHIHEAMEKGHAFFEWIAQRPDGSEFPAEIALHAMTLDGNTVIQAIMRDVSPQKEAEEALKAARDAAISAAEMKSQFVANVSHEVRTPMNGILGMTRLLLGSPLDARQQDYAKAITRSAEALMRMLNDLLDFSKIEAGHLHIERLDFDLRALLKDIVELYQPRTEAKGLHLRLECPNNIPSWVTGDPHRIRQILLNLTDNAIKFTHQGEITLRIGWAEDQHLKLAISDTGIGMNAEVQSRVFQAFAQGDGSTSRRYGGTGLGLAICKQLTELMNGRLLLTSRPGEGSTFSLELNLPVAQAPSEQVGDTVRVRYPGVRILVAEDNSVNQKLVCYMLEDLGIETLLAGDGKAAYELLAHERVDLVLMDCQMPEWDGLTSTQAIRERESRQGLPRLPVIALTANAMSGYAETCRQAGLDDYISKPLREDDLSDTLQRWLPHKAVRSEPSDSLSTVPIKQDETLIDLPRLRRLCQDDSHRLRDMLDLFVSSCEEQLDQIGHFLETGDASKAARLAHQIKGAAAYLGATAMMQQASDLESSGKANELDTCQQILADLEAHFIAIRLEIEPLLNG